LLLLGLNWLLLLWLNWLLESNGEEECLWANPNLGKNIPGKIVVAVGIVSFPFRVRLHCRWDLHRFGIVGEGKAESEEGRSVGTADGTE
jgi:hypothetical protein